jgi:hypothetical protein
MKKINKILLELYNDKDQLLFLSILGYISFLIESFIPSDPNIIYASGIWVGVATAGAAVIGAVVTTQQGKANREAAEEMSAANLAEQQRQSALLEKQKAVYREMEFENPYTDIENPYAGMENVYEDVTINQQQAQFNIEQAAQQRSNIMQQFRGAAGASGIAGLAQAMANQGALQTAQISASIGEQESKLSQLRAGEASRLQQMERQGAYRAEMMERSGEEMLQRAEMDRQSTLLGMQYGAAAGANTAYQQSLALEQQTNIANQQATASMIGDITGMAIQSVGMMASPGGALAPKV